MKEVSFDTIFTSYIEEYNSSPYGRDKNGKRLDRLTDNLEVKEEKQLGKIEFLADICSILIFYILEILLYTMILSFVFVIIEYKLNYTGVDDVLVTLIVYGVIMSLFLLPLNSLSDFLHKKCGKYPEVETRRLSAISYVLENYLFDDVECVALKNKNLERIDFILEIAEDSRRSEGSSRSLLMTIIYTVGMFFTEILIAVCMELLGAQDISENWGSFFLFSFVIILTIVAIEYIMSEFNSLNQRDRDNFIEALRLYKFDLLFEEQNPS